MGDRMDRKMSVQVVVYGIVNVVSRIRLPAPVETARFNEVSNVIRVVCVLEERAQEPTVRAMQRYVERVGYVRSPNVMDAVLIVRRLVRVRLVQPVEIMTLPMVKHVIIKWVAEPVVRAIVYT